MKAVDPAALNALLRRTRSLLACHLAFGLNWYPAAEAIHRFAAGRRPVPPPPASAKTPPAPAAEERAEAPASALSLKDLAGQLAGCRRCAAAAKGLPGSGGAGRGLVVLGDCCIGAPPVDGLFWGQKEDELFWRMMAAVQLGPDSVYVTNVIKCAQKELPNTGSWAGHSCLFWLEQELRLLRPRLICAMGETAAYAALGVSGRTIPLSRLRGKVHPCRLPGAAPAQVLVTYHPRALLQQQELKPAAWQDLQLLQRRLAEGPAPRPRRSVTGTGSTL